MLNYTLMLITMCPTLHVGVLNNEKFFRDKSFISENNTNLSLC